MFLLLCGDSFDDLLFHLHIFGDDTTAIGHTSGSTSEVAATGIGPAVDSNHDIKAASVYKIAELFSTCLL